MDALKLLIVDDDTSHLRMLSAVLTARGYGVETANSGESAVEKVSRVNYDLVIMDVKMGGIDGVDAMDAMISLRPGIAVVLMTAYGAIDAAVDAMKKGARDYITKPVDIDALHRLVEKTVSPGKHSFPVDTSAEEGAVSFDEVFPGIIGQSEAMQSVLAMVNRVARSDASVLIQGESGTGKELIAGAVHHLSHRKKNPFVTVNCASIPENLLESELFGHEKGAFTGAVKSRRGRFRQADGGTLFLDEIGEMAVPIQAKLLRALQERQFEPLGSGKTVQVDIRVLSATNKTLESEIADHRFREDLFYRLNVVTISLPPLRERVPDIMVLARFFMEKFSRLNQRHIAGWTPSVEILLNQYSWPGNVRELENVVERAVILARGTRISPEDLPSTIFPNGAEKNRRHARDLPETSLKEMEKQMILKTLEQNGGNRTRTSEILGISRRTLQLKLKKYGVN